MKTDPSQEPSFCCHLFCYFVLVFVFGTNTNTNTQISDMRWYGDEDGSASNKSPHSAAEFSPQSHSKREACKNKILAVFWSLISFLNFWRLNYFFSHSTKEACKKKILAVLWSLIFSLTFEG